MGATIRAVGRRWQPVLAVPSAAMSRHRSSSAPPEREDEPDDPHCGPAGTPPPCHAGSSTGKPRPLLIVLDCKGGPDARAKAERTRRLLHGAGAGRVAIWPDEATVSLWALPPADLAVTLFQMIETGTGPAAYYADITQAVSPSPSPHPRTPGRAAAFLDRLDPGWLEAAWAGGRPPGWPRVAAAAPAPGRHPASATAPCWNGSAPPWTAPAPSPTPTPGISSWKAPANSPSPKPRPWP